VKPDAALRADCADRFEIVERSGRRRAGRRHNRHDGVAFVAQTIERTEQKVNIHFVVA